MNDWIVKYISESKKELHDLDKGLKMQVLAGIKKVSQNPLPRPEGYGKPLGNKNGNNLTGLFKIKYKGIGIRVIYTLIKDKNIMKIITISARGDDYCYKEAKRLNEKYGKDIFEALFD